MRPHSLLLTQGFTILSKLQICQVTLRFLNNGLFFSVSEHRGHTSHCSQPPANDIGCPVCLQSPKHWPVQTGPGGDPPRKGRSPAQLCIKETPPSEVCETELLKTWVLC